MSISLRLRFTIIFVGLAIGPIALLGIVIGQRSFVSIERQSLEIQQGIASKVESEISAFLHAKADELEFLDQVFSLGTQDMRSQRRILSNTIMSRHVYQEFSLLDTKGMEQIRLSRSKVFLENDLESRADNDEFLVPMSTEQTFFGAVHFDSSIREPLMTVSVPLVNKSSGEISSVLVADLRFRSVWNVLLSHKLLDKQDIYVIDSDGVVVAHRNPSVVFGKTTVSLPDVDGRGIGLHGTKSLLAMKEIALGTYGVVVVAEQSITAALDLAYHTLRATVVITAIVLIISLGLVLAVIRQSVEPIRALAKHAKNIAQGDFSKLTNIPRTSSELNELGQAFNTMIRALRQRDESVREQQLALQEAHDELEKRVADRTADLADTNEQLRREAKERERAERAMREERDRAQLYFDVAGSILMVLDSYGDVQLINRKGIEILEVPDGKIVGQNWFECFIPEKSRDEIGEVFRRLMAEEIGPMEYYENSILSGSGDEKLIGWHNTILRDRSGIISGVLSSGTDLTQRRRLEDEQQRVQKLESVGVLAGGIAHDSNNILTAVLGSISLAKLEASQSGEIEDTLSEAEKACWQLKGLNQQLLTFSKGGAPIKKLTAMGGLVRESCDFALRGSNIACTYALPEDLWTAEVDQSQIGQVLNNLIINAIQAMPRGGTIHVSAENHFMKDQNPEIIPPGRYIRISVRDHGIGIAEESLKKIFDPYFTTKGQGSGLGLAISYSVTKGHGGYITAESELQKGTVINLLLPASHQTVIDSDPIGMSAELGGGTILIMDDQKEVRDVLCRMIERLGYNVETAEDGTQAIDIYKRAMKSTRPIDVVILDLTVPGGLGGKETMEELLKLDPETTAIVSSGYSHDQIMSEYAAYGFSGVMSKPYDIRELGMILKNATSSFNST